MSKAAEAFRTISEVAEELAIQKHVLRFWESKFPQIRPMKRGGGRRYYRPEDLDLLRGIRHLLHDQGYTIKGVQKILREQGVDMVKGFGRDDSGAVQTREGRQQQPPLPAPAPTPKAIGARAKQVGGESRRIIQAAISELQACRRILAGERPAAAMRRRSRAGR